MPWRLIGFIICIVLVTVFAGFNLDNSCNISFVFFQLENVPIFFSLMAAFVLGVLVVLPFTFGKKRAKKAVPVQPAEPKQKNKPSKKNKIPVPQPAASPVSSDVVPAPSTSTETQKK